MSVQYNSQFYIATILRPWYSCAATPIHKVMSVGTIVMHKSQEDTSVAKTALGLILQHDSLHHQKQH